MKKTFIVFVSFLVFMLILSSLTSLSNAGKQDNSSDSESYDSTLGTGENNQASNEEKNDIDFSNKIYVAFGDSITYGVDGVSSNRFPFPYPSLVATRLGILNSKNYAVSGATVSYFEGLPNLNSQLDASIAKADIVSVMIGVNDYARSCELGSINDNDLTTVYGGLNVFVEGLKEKYPDAFIFFMTPYPCYYFTGVNSAGYELTDVCKAIKEVCAKNDIPVLDMYNLGEFTMENCPNSDGIHPSQTFIMNYTSPQIAQFIREN